MVAKSLISVKLFCLGNFQAFHCWWGKRLPIHRVPEGITRQSTLTHASPKKPLVVGITQLEYRKVFRLGQNAAVNSSRSLCAANEPDPQLPARSEDATQRYRRPIVVMAVE